MKKTSYIFMVLSALLTLASCHHETPKPATEPVKFALSDTMQKIIKIDEVVMDKVDGVVSLNGEVTYDQNNVIKVMPLVSGMCQDVNVNIGDRVSAGQTLAMIKSTEAAGLQNDMVSAKANVAMAKKNLEVAQSMQEKGVASQRDVLQAQQDLTKAESDLTRVTSQLSIIGSGSSGPLVQLTCPQNGFIVERKLNPNQLIRTDDGSPLFTVSDLKKVWVMANVYEVDVEKIKKGDDVIVKTLAHPDNVFKGKIDFISNALDPVSRTLQVRVVLDNPDYLLKPQMYARVAVSFKENDKQMPQVPSESVVFDRSRNYVVVYHAKDNLEIREVEILDAQGPRTFIKSGLQPGEKVISKEALLIYQAIRQ
jgi:cobalt-zinc-cadmium efflux system membrane fusion protein